MTDNEIIKALECCSHRNGDLPCEDCPAYKIAQMCMEDLMSDAIDLINRQKAEIERLNMDNKEINILINMQEKNIREQQEIINTLIILNKSAKSETIKEFADRLKEKCHNYYPSIDSYCTSRRVVEVKDIDNLVKERTEVQE